MVVRPIETEPKMKVYISVTADDKDRAEEIEKVVNTALASCMN